MPDWLVTITSRNPASISRRSAGPAPGMSSSLAGSLRYSLSMLMVPSRSRNTARFTERQRKKRAAETPKENFVNSPAGSCAEGVHLASSTNVGQAARLPGRAKRGLAGTRAAPFGAAGQAGRLPYVPDATSTVAVEAPLRGGTTGHTHRSGPADLAGIVLQATSIAEFSGRSRPVDFGRRGH